LINDEVNSDYSDSSSSDESLRIVDNESEYTILSSVMNERFSLEQKYRYVGPEGNVKYALNADSGPQFCYGPTYSNWLFYVSMTVLESESNLKNTGVFDSTYNPWKSLQTSINVAQESSFWCVIMLQSGRFAAGIFDGGQLILHKVFRRYCNLRKHFLL
jgi:hypothetical protein